MSGGAALKAFLSRIQHAGWKGSQHGCAEGSPMRSNCASVWLRRLEAGATEFVAVSGPGAGDHVSLGALQSAPPRRKIIARIDDVVRAAQNIALSRFPIRGVSTANTMSGADPHFYWTGARRVTARAPIWRPYSVPTFVALRKWKPTSTRE